MPSQVVRIVTTATYQLRHIIIFLRVCVDQQAKNVTNYARISVETSLQMGSVLCGSQCQKTEPH